MNTHTPDDELLSAYVDGELSPTEVELVDRWLSLNPQERRRIEQFRAIGGAIRSLPQDELPAQFCGQLMGKIERELLLPRSPDSGGPAAGSRVRSGVHRSWMRFGGLVLAPVAATALGVMLVFSNLLPNAPGRSSDEESFPPVARSVDPHAGRVASSSRATDDQTALPAPSSSMPATGFGEQFGREALEANAIDVKRELSEFKSSLSDALNQQQKNPELTVLLTIAVSEPRVGESMVASQSLALQKTLASFFDRRFESLDRTSKSKKRGADQRVKATAKPGDPEAAADSSPRSEDDNLMMLVVGNPDAFVEALFDALQRDADETVIMEVANTEVLELNQELNSLIGDYSEQAEGKLHSLAVDSEIAPGGGVDKGTGSPDLVLSRSDGIAASGPGGRGEGHPGIVVELSAPHGSSSVRRNRDAVPAEAAVARNHPADLPAPGPVQGGGDYKLKDPSKSLEFDRGRKSGEKALRKFDPASAPANPQAESVESLQTAEVEPQLASSRVLIQFVMRSGGAPLESPAAFGGVADAPAPASATPSPKKPADPK